MQGAVNLNGLLAEFRQHAHQDIQAHLQLIAEQYGVSRGGKKGNVTLTSYDGTLRVQIAVGEFLDFGPELHSAKDLNDQCLTDWRASAGEELRAIVTDRSEERTVGKACVSTCRYRWSQNH